MKTSTLVNGVAHKTISVDDRGLHYGDGLFETIAVYQGKPLLWEAHLQRLSDGCARLGIVPPPADVLQTEVESLCPGVQRGVLKLIITRGSSARGYRAPQNPVPTRVLTLSPWPDYPEDYALAGVAVRLCQTRLSLNQRLAGLKHINRLEQVLARGEWQDEVQEGLMQDTDGRVIEGTMSNLFLVVDGGLLTPDLSHSGVAGILRAQVLHQARTLGIPCRIETIDHDSILRAEEIFLTNCIIGIWPVKKYEGKVYQIGKTTQALQTALTQRLCYERKD